MPCNNDAPTTLRATLASVGGGRWREREGAVTASRSSCVHRASSGGRSARVTHTSHQAFAGGRDRGGKGGDPTSCSDHHRLLPTRVRGRQMHHISASSPAEWCCQWPAFPSLTHGPCVGTMLGATIIRVVWERGRAGSGGGGKSCRTLTRRPLAPALTRCSPSRLPCHSISARRCLSQPWSIPCHDG